MASLKKDIELLVNVLQLMPHPEGGYYNEVYRATDKIGVAREKYGDAYRASATSIYFLLKGDDFSAWHKIKSDEIWNYHEGNSINILSINPQGVLKQHKLGSKLSDPDAEYQVVIPAGDWFCAYVEDGEGYTLVGCTVAPGFEFVDFEIADRNKLTQEFKQHQALIHKFTRGS
ncbi:MAG TPA: cupin domain-containing protein [Gammaproteobacteria bacterium]|nr:cupin domain-containing protein [Gammaproteobacteria bacterium]